MIISIQHKGLKRLWTKRFVQIATRPGSEDQRYPGSFEFYGRSYGNEFPGSALHSLKGQLAGYWAFTVKANWRIIFQVENGNVYLIDYVDYQ